MKLLYIWIEEFRNITHQGIIVDDEYIVTINEPDNVVFNYYTSEGNKIAFNGKAPRFGLKVFERYIEVEKNNNYRNTSSNSVINSISALVGKNAVGKSSILECLSSQENEYLIVDDRHYFLVFLNEVDHCIEIRSRGVRIKAENIKCLSLRKHDNYERYVISLNDSSPTFPYASSENTQLFFLTPQKKTKPFSGYDVLNLPTIVGDLDSLDKYNSHEGVFDFLCDFPQLGGEDNKLVVFLKEEDNRHSSDYFTDSKFSSEQYKILFIYRLAKILFSNLRLYLYHQKPVFTMDGSRRQLPNEDILLQEDKQCAKLLSFTNIAYPNADSFCFARINVDEVPQDAIEHALEFFASSTFSFMGKKCYDDYITSIRCLFRTIIDADSSLFTALYKMEIPFESCYKPIVSAMQTSLRLDFLGGRWTSGVNIDFEWFSSGEYHLAMLFSAIYQRMTKEKLLAGRADVVWFIDEPEMHMHPELGRTFLDALNKAMQEFYSTGFVGRCQFLLATHSPFIVQSLSKYNSSLTLVCKNSHQITTQPFENLPQLKLPGRTDFSFNLIMYKIFDVPTIELHNELYGVLQEISNCSSETKIETWFESKGLSKNMQWIRAKNDCPNDPYSVTLQTYIRNSIHHPENRFNQYKFTDLDLRTSIDGMINLL